MIKLWILFSFFLFKLILSYKKPFEIDKRTIFQSFPDETGAFVQGPDWTMPSFVTTTCNSNMIIGFLSIKL